MPAQKHSNDSQIELPRNNHVSGESEELNDDVQQPQEQQHESDDDEEDDSSSSSSSSDGDEFVYVKLAEIRKDVQCPICLGIIRKTRKVMECLHRFCRECIDKSMRLGNNECPACRTHCASRRSLRDDPNYDALIALLYPDIDKYEAEESAFDENDKARNKKIQAQIEQTSRRQTEALGKKRASAKATANAFIRRSQGNTRNLRGRKRKRSGESQGSDNELDNDNDNGDKYSSSSDELEPESEPISEVRPKRYKRWSGGPSSLPSSSGANGGSDDNEPEGSRKMVGSQEILTWGRGGIRSNTRHGGQIASSGKGSRNRQFSKLINHLQKFPRNDDELDIHFRLGSMNEEIVPNLQESYVCCKPTTSITIVRQYIARASALRVEDIELFLVIRGRCVGEMPLLEDHQILSDIAKMSSSDDLTINIRQKEGKLSPEREQESRRRVIYKYIRS